MARPKKVVEGGENPQVNEPKLKKVQVHTTTSRDGITMTLIGNDLNFNIIAAGKTFGEAKEDLIVNYEGLRTWHQDNGYEFEEVEFIF